MPVSPKDVLTDPRFEAMSPEQKRQVLMRIDPNFSKLSKVQQDQVIAFKPPAETFMSRFYRPETPEDEALVRELKSLGGTFASLFDPRTYAQAASMGKKTDDPLKDLDLRQRLGDEGLRKIGPTGRLIERMMIEPTRQAVDWYSKVARGEVPNAYEQALSVMPEAIGAGGGVALGGRVLQKSPELAKVPGAVKESVAIGAQDAAGAGREPVLLKRMAAAEENRLREESTKAANEAAVGEARDRYEKELEKWRSGEEKNSTKAAEARRDLMRKTETAERTARERAGRPAEKRGAERRVTDYAEDFQKNAKRGEAQQRAGLNKRWDVFRRLTQSAALPRGPLYDLVTMGREKLAGAPGDVKLFNDFMKEIGLEKSDSGELQPRPGVEGDMPLNTARVHSTAIGEKLAGGGLSGNVFQALKFVKKGLESDIEKVADQHGAGDFYRALKGDWATYMTDWRDSDSPLANVVKATNPADVESIMLGDKTRGNLSQLAAKYQGLGKTTSGQGGLTPTTISAAARLAQNVKDLPATRAVSGPRQGMMLQSESPALATARAGMPKVAEPTPPPTEVPPELKTAKQETVDPVNERRKILLAFAGRPFRPTDVFPSFGGTHLALKYIPGFLEWLAKQPRSELPLPERGPEPAMETAMRGGEGPKLAAQQNSIWQGVVDNLREKLKREKEANSSQQYFTRIKLMDAEEKLKTTFGGSQYATSPKTMSATGGGGANYTAGDLDALKKKYGIQ